MCTYFNTKSGAAKNLIYDFFFLTLIVRGPFHRKNFMLNKYVDAGLTSEKMELLYTEHNERAEAATGSYSGTEDSLHYIYSVPVFKNHRNIQSRYQDF